ncbi:MAG: 2-dehydropantoate 2-reductase [Anaerolineales bacterium]
MKPISVLVFGAGAIGTYVGGSLALAGQRVVFIEHPSVAAELHERGLRLDVTIDKQRGATEPLIVPPSSLECASSLEEALQKGPFDVAIFAMKSFDTAAALEEIKPFKDKVPPILCLQNGVDNEPAIAAALGPDHVIPGTITVVVARLAAGDIVLEKARGMGITAGYPLSDRLVAVMNIAGLNARLYSHAADMKWSKVLANLPGSATSAIVDMSPAEVFAHPGLYELEMRMAHEALAVIAAQGAEPVNLPKIPVKALALAMRLPPFLARPVMTKVVGGGRGGKMPSFHIDLHAGRKKSEVEYLHGAVVRYGEISGIQTPVSRLLTETLLAMVRGEIPIAEFSRQPDKLIGLLAN